MPEPRTIDRQGREAVAPPEPASSSLPFVVLAAGVLIASTSSILIRWAQIDGVPSLSIAAWRMLMAAAVVLPLAWRVRHEWATLSGREWMLALSAGACLAAHFATWIQSLEYTSVASSAALVTTNPIWVGLASWWLFGERPGRATGIGIALALGGSLIILFADAGDAAATASHPQALLGNLLALAGAVSVSGYFLCGRSLGTRLGLLAYVGLVYTTAAVVLCGAALLTGAPLSGFSTPGFLAVAGLAIGPQLLGHTAFNWALRRLSATFVALSILGEPIGSALFAWVLFDEGFGVFQGAGFVLLLAGITAAALGERRSTRAG